MNTLTPEIHQDANFDILYDAIEKRIQERPVATSPEREETKVVGTGTSEKAADGLMALRELMQRSPDVRNAVIEFQTDFRVSYEQVDQLGDYKDIHDLLHNLQFSCYNGIIYAAARFPGDDEALDILNEHVLTFESIVDELRNVASQPSMPKQELRWIDEAEQMKGDFHIALNTMDEKKLKSVIAKLNRLLAIHPARINTLLTQSARALRLPTLWSALARICNDLTLLNLDPDRVKAFQVGVDALDKLQQALSDLVDKHDRWQNLEVDLRLSESLVDRDPDQFEMDWSDIKSKSEQLYTDSADEWATALKEESSGLEEALSNHNPVKVRRCFRNYQRRAANRFYQVDKQLKELCGSLRQIGVPLASVLEMIQ
jgi:hypothetical protein